MADLITRLLKPEHVQLPLPGRTLADAVASLVARLSARDCVRDSEAVVRSVLARENHISTVVGNGVALPHARTEAVTGLCAAVGIAPEGLDLSAPDGLPVQIVVMMVAPADHHGPYIRLLAQISRTLISHDTRRDLVAADSPEEILQLLTAHRGGFADPLHSLLAGRHAA